MDAANEGKRRSGWAKASTPPGTICRKLSHEGRALEFQMDGWPFSRPHMGEWMGRRVAGGISIVMLAAICLHAAPDPDPGRPVTRRLTRTEYANTIRDLLDLEIDAASLLPADESLQGL